MGIRSTILIVDKNNSSILNLFGMFDGDQVGQQIIEFLKGKKLVNGINVMIPEEDQLNGIGDAALRLAHYLKEDRTGGWYATPIDNEPDEYYAYSMIEKDGFIELQLNGDVIWPVSIYDKDHVAITEDEDGYAIMIDGEWILELYIESEWYGFTMFKNSHQYVITKKVDGIYNKLIDQGRLRKHRR